MIPQNMKEKPKDWVSKRKETQNGGIFCKENLWKEKENLALCFLGTNQREKPDGFHQSPYSVKEIYLL